MFLDNNQASESQSSQDTPNNESRNDQISFATRQWSKKHSIDSSKVLHKQLQSIIMMFHFQRLSTIKFFSNTYVEEKKVTFQGTLAPHMTLSVHHKMIELQNFRLYRSPKLLSLTLTGTRIEYNKSKKVLKIFQLPVLKSSNTLRILVPHSFISQIAYIRGN